MIAALYVQTGGAYFGLPDVDPWDEPRNALRYRGPHAVVAHPPCTRWCRLAGLVESRWGYQRGVDGGTFAHALGCVRAYGGVLEHPAFSDAWATYGLDAPSSRGGWTKPDAFGGSSCYVEQHAYGHRARKGTWLYVVGAPLPEMRWGYTYKSGPDVAMSGWCANRVATDDKRARLKQGPAAATPPDFREALLRIARSARGVGTFRYPPRVRPRQAESPTLFGGPDAFRRAAHARLK